MTEAAANEQKKIPHTHHSATDPKQLNTMTDCAQPAALLCRPAAACCDAGHGLHDAAPHRLGTYSATLGRSPACAAPSGPCSFREVHAPSPPTRQHANTPRGSGLVRLRRQSIPMAPSFFLALAAHPFLSATALISTPYLLVFVALQKKMFSAGATRCLTRFYFRPMAPAVLGFQALRSARKPTCVAEGIYLGTFPSATLGDVKRLHDLGVGGVINLMDEWQGPTGAYSKFGIEQLYLPTIDHVEPTVEDMERAVAFIRRVRQTGQQSGVFIHCKGGHGRSAAIAVAWLMADQRMSPEQAAQHLLARRRVRKKLASQPNINMYWDSLHAGFT